MPKTPSSRLFDLVKSLSGSEKRYFKIAAKADGDSKYLRLFEAIEQQVIFEEAALQQAVYGGEKIQSRKYSELKSYLYDLILKQLQQYDESTSVDYLLKSALLSVRSLYRRLRFSDCDHLLRRAKKQAKRYERFDVLMEILSWEKQLAYARADVDYLDNELAALVLEEQACIQALERIKTYESLFYELYTLIRKNTLRSEEIQQQVAVIKIHPSLLDQAPNTSYRSQLLYLRIQAMIHYHERDIIPFYETNKAILIFMEEKPYLLREDTSHYIAALSNFIIGCSYQSRFDEMREALDKLKRVPPATRDDELKIHAQYYASYFSLCIRTANFKLGELIMKQHLAERKKLAKNLFERNTFYFQYFYICFANGQYNEALTYLNTWLGLPQTVEQQDLQALAKLLNLILHYEIGNYLLLESLLRSTQRKLKKQAALGQMEAILIQCIRHAIQAPDRRQKQAIFQQAYEQLKSLELSEREHALLRFFNMETWLLSKAKQLPFAEALQTSTTDA